LSVLADCLISKYGYWTETAELMKGNMEFGFCNSL
jgi:hypothetical protein